MKKFIAILLSLVLVLSISVFASADTLTSLTESSTEVKASYSEGTAATTVYSVDITWDMSFTYTGESKGTWQPSSHTYSGTTSASWSDSTGSVTVTNHSNAKVAVAFSFTPENGFAGTFGTTSTTLDAATEGSAQDTAPSTSSTLTITSGTISANNTKIGTAKVTLTAGT